MAFKDSLKTARLNAGMTQQALGAVIGVAKSTITGYEKGNSEPDMAKLQKIIETLKIDANFLFQDELRQLQTNYASHPNLDALIGNYSQLNVEGKEKILSYSDDMVQSGKYSSRIETIATSEKYRIKSTTRSEYEQEADEFAKMAREQFLFEKKQEEKAYFAKKLDAG